MFRLLLGVTSSRTSGASAPCDARVCRRVGPYHAPPVRTSLAAPRLFHDCTAPEFMERRFPALDCFTSGPHCQPYIWQGLVWRWRMKGLPRCRLCCGLPRTSQSAGCWKSSPDSWRITLSCFCTFWRPCLALDCARRPALRHLLGSTGQPRPRRGA